MALILVRELIHDAKTRKYALGYFESWNFESLQGVLDAAEETRSPIIVGFSGDFLSRKGRLHPERLDMYASLGKAAASGATVPCGFIFNECPHDDWVRRACDVGFNLVMPADPEAPLPVYERWVKEIVDYARPRGVAVEAEVGVLPCGASGKVTESRPMTDPAAARAFFQQTGVDLLAVSVGNVHIRVSGEGELDLKRVEQIAARTNAPLVLHGGSGIAADSLKSAIAMGVVKVNYGTYLKQRYLKAVRGALTNPEVNPHELMGLGGESDVMTVGRVAVRDAVLERIGILGCCDKAG
jgi:ketose-bisphosphate aldolase